ncbi:hypothetical protein PHYPSEUDO_005833 [Phytophthora pseudosyringae]|uniref:Uncharacterized protein n=1 Tax=Phytophthora pseudosyringae TaxID=221518 RepID=A0A8T1WCH3_9STRA|nr:hypothetical protein PHYPSEUDO_005833 [Phytophthora pseudosyringae]
MEIFNDLNLVLQLNQHIQGVSVSTTDGARLRTPASPPARQTSFKVLTNLECVSYSESREDAQFEHQRSIFLSVSSSDLPFHLQGDRDFNEASAIAKRRALRFSEAIKTRIEFLWDVAGGKKRAEMAQRVRQQQLADDEQGRGRRGQQSVRRAGAGNDIKQLLPPLEELDEEDYMALMLLIFKVLRDDFVLELAHKQIQCDWEVDSHHGKSLSFDQFFAAVFELVDVWTCDMEEATYDRFIHLLARRITRRVAVFLDGAELKLSLSDNFEPEVVVKAIPLRTVPKFVSVARVVAAIGVTTVGELARADPKEVERGRLEFIQRNNGGVVPESPSDMRKIGQDLQTLLAMFKSIALQFENISYALDNNVLRRIPTAAGPRPQPGDNRRDAGETIVGTGPADQSRPEGESVNGDVCIEAGINGNTRTRSLGNNPVGAKPPSASGGGNPQRTRNKSDAEIRQGQSTAGGGITSGSIRGDYTQSTDTDRPGSLVHDRNFAAVHNAENARPNERNVSVTGSKNNNPSTKTQALGASESSAPINSIHDLQLADAGVVNALRSTFLIEKAISIERQTELAAIREELVKFGVDFDAMKLPEEAVRDRYNTLYDLLVLRDGESLKTLAGVMLEQIKFELSVHGITVDEEEDVEEVYDGFFATVMTGTGDSIVQDAQRWMESTVQGNKVNDYIQHDFHELESLDEVELLGTKRGDEEFLGLLANDADSEDEAAETTNKPTGRKNSSPIQRKLSRVIVKIPHVATPQEDQTRSPGPVENPLPHSPPEQVPIPVKDDADEEASDERKKKKVKKKIGHVKPSHVGVPQPLAQTSAPVEEKHSSGGAQTEKSPAVGGGRKPKLTISTQANTEADVPENMAGVKNDNASLGPPIEATDASAPDDAKLNKSNTLSSRHGRSNTELDLDAASGKKDHHDTSDQHTARGALNIAIELEEDDTAQSVAGAKVDGERPISMEPKMPKILIGGSASATNVPVTGRYIQLLGLGTVLITKAERDFFQLLRSHESLDTDLVCFDIGTELDTALTKLQTIQGRVGNRVILFGGNPDEPDKTQLVAIDCLAHGALYFATIPFDFPRLREKIMTFFENSKQPYILRQRKPPGQAAQVGSSIGAGSLFAMHDEPRKVSTSVAFAKTPRRKLAVAISALPSLSHSAREIPQPLPQGLSETRRADFTPTAPSTPRSQSRNRSPRFSTALNKLIR